MRRVNRQIYTLIGTLIVAGLSALEAAQAQVIPDGTVPTQVSGERNISISKGQQVGSNLFHSFEQFDIPANGSVFFDGPTGVQNIITRVTGTSASQIDGSIRANGSANLFLLNPNGVTFGPNASLNISGSFLASSATSLRFADGTQFSTQSPPPGALLTMSAPVGLQFGAAPGALVNQSQFKIPVQDNLPTSPAAAVQTVQTRTVGLQVNQGQTLVLIGGDVVLEGGLITASGGQISLGSVVGNSRVGLQPSPQGWVVDYTPAIAFADIRLSNLAIVDASGTRGGRIQAQGRDILLTGGSKLLSNTTGDRSGGRVDINASESVQVLGTTDIPGVFEPFEASVGILVPIRSGISTNTFGAGKAGDIQIQTQALILRDGAQVTAAAAGATGQGGNLTIRASESVEISGTSIFPEGQENNGPFSATGFGIDAPGFGNDYFLELNTVSALGTVSAGVGASGNLRVETGRLVIQDGGLISTSSFGPGAAGALTVNASESILLRGTSASGVIGSGLFAPTITTGPAGDLSVKTGQLTIQGGANIATNTLGSGQGGTIDIIASEFVKLEGTSENGTFKSGLSSQSFGVGNAGSVRVVTGQLAIDEGAGIALGSVNTAEGGNIEVQAQAATLDNGAFILANTESGRGGNIQLNIADQLLLQRGSRASATAGEDLTNGNGGNINISAALLVALSESRITAEAFSGRGGNIKILTTGGLFQSPDSVISASSALNDDGTVLINNPDVDPSDGTLVLPETIAITPKLAQGCRPGGVVGPGQFVRTGRGGLPPRPTDLQSTAAIWQDLRPPGALMPVGSAKDAVKVPPAHELSIVEAKGWVKTAQGMILVAPKQEAEIALIFDPATC
ncbi:MAG: filamentous hemagglutinin N-terminal domain-containing protein [Thermosynechococcaceae cyanobacterium]